MLNHILNHLYIASTVAFTVYSQLIMRWQVKNAGGLPEDLYGKLQYIMHLLLNPWVITGLAATFFSGISWMMAITKFETSYAYPFISLNFILVTLASVLIFNESMTTNKILGTLFIVTGIIIVAKGQTS